MRQVLIVSHTGREAAVRAQRQLEEGLSAHGLEIVHDPSGAVAPEVGIVLGGDGTILRAAELVRGSEIPLVGINLGHVGFLAESEVSEIDDIVTQVAQRRYSVERRETVDVTLRSPDGRTQHGWAMNEASLEKAERERMVEVTIGVDGLGLSTFGGDGVVMSTATGSTAYAFSSGGPVVWPDVDALLMVPISAHALFARPLVVGPASVLSVEVLQRSPTSAVLWCDGRRRLDVPPGSHVDVRRGEEPVLLARLHRAPFSERLVRKFDLPVVGWRGPVEPAGGHA